MADPHETPDTEKQSTMTLVREALTQISSMVRNEVDLARTEVSENMNKAVGALISLAVALVFAIVALNSLAVALIGLLSSFLDIGGGWSSLIVFALFAVIAFVFQSKGRKDLSARSLAPKRTTENIRRDANTVREATK